MAARWNCVKVAQLLKLAPCQHIRRLPQFTLAKTLCSSSSPKTPPADHSPAVEMPEGEDRPHMLHVVWRLRSVKRRPYWEKDIIKQLMLERKHFPVVHKNTESVNALLRKVRHLVRIKPLVLKQGLPQGDYNSTLLKWNGEFVVRRKLDSLGQEVITAEGEETNDGLKADAEKTAVKDTPSTR